MTYDPAFMNTASCRRAITFIDGDKGILEYRGYPIEQLAEKSTYLEVAYLLINGELPDQQQLDEWTHEITTHTFVHENVKQFIDGFRYDAHPMGMLLATVGALCTFYPDAKQIDDRRSARPDDPPDREDADARRLGLPPHARACRSSIRTTTSATPATSCDDDKMAELKYEPDPRIDRRSTCSSSSTPITSRTAPRTRCARSAARRSIRTRPSPPASRALYGPLHGGANEAVLRMLREIGSTRRTFRTSSRT